MLECDSCGRALNAGATFCPSCGAIPPGAPVARQAVLPTGELPAVREVAPVAPVTVAPAPAPNNPAGLIVAVLAAVLVVAAAGLGSAFAATHHWAAGSAEPAPGLNLVTTQPTAPATDPADPSTGPATTPESSAPAQPASESQAQAALNAEVAQDLPGAQQLVGSWVPQLSSKKPGLVANGVTYDYLAIWQDFQKLKSQYPMALLIWSGDFSTYQSADFWVTIVAQPYSDGTSANGWCDNASIDANDCYAKLLSHTAGPTGATVLRQ